MFVICIKYSVCQANDTGGNVTQNNIHEVVTLATTPSVFNESTLIIANEIEEVSNESDSNDTVTWELFISVLKSVSLDQLKQIKSNIKNYYNLGEKEIAKVNKAFNATDLEYEYLLQYKLKKMIEEKRFNESEDFLLDFMDLSNFLIEKILEYSLAKLKEGTWLARTNWHRQTLKEKIFRQQVKLGISLIEMQMCNALGLCKEREHYSDYIIEWLRILLNDGDAIIGEVLTAVPVVLEKYSTSIKSNVMFRKNLLYASKTNASAQRDVLDFIDEVITNENVFKFIPNVLKKCAVLLIELLNEINDVYDLNDNNIEELETVSHMFMSWNGGATGIEDILDMIIKNMQFNLKGWSKEKQAKINKIWSAIIFL
ncbi:uncharacterized protein LOC114365821 [Ostrinia furnacalis]|uniref:uncharacterized protein LOC114365821 n=1 Tax=Ostrinia furnacalis TaxID=93504 RepID=UPI00103D40CF|nr:uncharacterized protein LOC114365821 [Ostrinia furnacalis]